MTASLPETHPTLGQPDKVYPYRNGSGDIVAAIYRFEPIVTGDTRSSGNSGGSSRIGLVGPTGPDGSRPEKAVKTGPEETAPDRSRLVQAGLKGGIPVHSGQTGSNRQAPEKPALAGACGTGLYEGVSGQTGQIGFSRHQPEIPVAADRSRGDVRPLSPTSVGFSRQGPAKARKEIRPYCLQAQDWVRPVAPILYDLDAIASDRSSPVILVEGEKCADALAGLGFLATTSMGGSNAARFTDWSPLAGREVIIWPDHDAPGAKYASTVADLCWQAGAASVALVDLAPDTLERAVQTGGNRWDVPVSAGDHRLSPEPVGIARTDIHALLEGWDAADAIAEGWTRGHVQVLLDQAKPVEHRSPPVATPLCANDNWPEPDRSFLEEDTAPPVFPMEIFPHALADWILKAAKSKSAPVDYVAASVLTGAASLIGSARRISLWDGWSEPAILWSAIVGNPSAGKSPAMDPVLSALSAIEGDSLSDFEDAIRRYETLKMEADLVRSGWERKAKEAVEMGGSPPLLPEGAQTPDMPVRKRLTIRDATVEALLAALKGQQKGLLMTRDELAGWFASFDRYSGSKGGDRALWLEAFGGRSYVVDRVKNGGEALHIPSLGISVIGGMQPDKLESCLLKGDDDGLSSRFLYFCPRPAQRQRPMHSTDQRLFERWMRKLDALVHDVDENGKPMPRHIPLSEAGVDVFHPWWQGLLKRDTDNARMNGWWGKAQGKASRLALVLEYLEWAVSSDAMEPLEVTADTMEKAISFMDAYAGPMAEIAHGAASRSEADANTLKLARHIQEQGFHEFSVRDLQRSGPTRALKASEIKTACFNLVGHGWLQAAPVRQGDTPGKSQGRFLVNPAL